MDMYSKILVPLDGSPLAERALEPALEMARTTGSEIILLEAVQDSLAAVPEARYLVPLKETYRSAISSMKYLRNIASRLRPHVGKIRWHVEEGDPIDAILSFAHNEDVDIIVMGTHGRTGISRVVMGSVAEKVSVTTHRPVVLVKPDRSTLHLQQHAA
jgi:nucleotide-binding universal stress UspA family protein